MFIYWKGRASGILAARGCCADLIPDEGFTLSGFPCFENDK